MTDPGSALAAVRLEHVEWYVGDAEAAAADLIDRYGFAVVGRSGPDAGPDATGIALTQGDIRLVLTQPLSDEHPAAVYVQRHGDGVADVALRTPDARAAFEEAVARGATVVREPVDWPDGSVTATIGGFGDVTHTIVQRPGDPNPALLPAGYEPVPAADPAEHPLLWETDHLAVCLEIGELDPTVEFYETVLGFPVIFVERIVVGRQAMLSKVVQSPSRAVTLTLIQPDPSAEPGQIDNFLKDHGGPGVQHVAFRSDHVVAAVSALRDRGVEFLAAPAAYYRRLPDRLELDRYSADELRSVDVLADADHDGQLYQIFARSTHPNRTFFFEVIERLGARSFGSGNIKALYEAVEAEQVKA